MRPAVRKVALTAHVASSVGWLGAVIVFLTLGIIALLSSDPATVRGVYLVMEPAARWALVPLAFASLLTGCIQALLTDWGLFRHYWIVFKLSITVFATVILLVYLRTFRIMSIAAADRVTDLGMVRNLSPVIHAALALLLFLVAMTLAIYKPRGMTSYGWRTRYGGT